MSIDPISGRRVKIIRRQSQEDNQQSLFDTAKPTEIKKQIEIQKTKKKDNNLDHKEVAKESITMIKTIKILMIFIGTGATLISIYYTSIWFMEILNSFLSIVLSTIMIVFSILAFEISIYLLAKRRSVKNILILSVYSLLWLIVTSFSITSTIAGQYNSYERVKKENGLSQMELIRQRELDILVEQRKDKKVELGERIEERKFISKKLGEMETLEQMDAREHTYNRLNKKLGYINSRLYRIRKELNSIDKKLITAIPRQEKTVDFYSWLANIFQMDRNFIQFLISIFPAIFVDIIAPTAFATAFLGMKENG